MFVCLRVFKCACWTKFTRFYNIINECRGQRKRETKGKKERKSTLKVFYWHSITHSTIPIHLETNALSNSSKWLMMILPKKKKPEEQIDFSINRIGWLWQIAVFLSCFRFLSNLFQFIRLDRLKFCFTY